jgi:hypothetical protein
MQTQHQTLPKVREQMIFSSLMKSAGVQYWLFALLPAFVGLTLPFWLNKGSSMSYLHAIVFICITVFFYAACCLLAKGLDFTKTWGWNIKQLIVFGSLCLMVALILTVVVSMVLSSLSTLLE